MTPIEQLKIYFDDEMTAMNALIRERMVSEHAPRIADICAHIVGAGGKQLRPLLPVAIAAVFGYRGQNHIRLAASVEFIHTATLLHDDVVDESTQRRGKTTANLLWDNKSSILVGDYLFSRAFQLMVETKSLDVLRVLSNASATIAEGEVLQITVAGRLSTTIETHLRIIRAKTATLFGAATKGGGLVAGADPEQLENLWKFGDAIGICFQLVDDLLDYTGTAAIGKNIGDDFREGKLTLPVILSVAKSSDKESVFWRRVIEEGAQQPGDLEQAIEIMSGHGVFAEAKGVALEWAKQAKVALSKLPKSEILDMLEALPDYVVARIN